MSDNDADVGPLGPGGPGRLCFAWLEAMLRDEPHVEAAWALMEENLRTCAVQQWVWANREHPTIAGDIEGVVADLVEADVDDDDWRTFAGYFAQESREEWMDWYRRGIGAMADSRPIGPDLELVLLVPTDGQGTIIVDDSNRAQVDEATKRFLVRLGTDGCWRLASLDSQTVPTPGLPPTW